MSVMGEDSFWDRELDRLPRACPDCVHSGKTSGHAAIAVGCVRRYDRANRL
jgi:hypothetical protein